MADFDFGMEVPVLGVVGVFVVMWWIGLVNIDVGVLSPQIGPTTLG